jgi:hypothetical protein
MPSPVGTSGSQAAVVSQSVGSRRPRLASGSTTPTTPTMSSPVGALMTCLDEKDEENVVLLLFPSIFKS